MTQSHSELWRHLEAFELDDPAASLTFTQRLARENGWDAPFARRVVQEYKRFVFLAMTAGHEVTPSDEVDQAWHLHLTYTRSYWGELCGEVLARPLHHGPTRGGKAEGDRFEDQYERTLESYRAAFGEPAPADIWPPSEVRFGEAADFVRVNRQRVWVMPKPWKRNNIDALAIAAGLTAVPPLALIDSQTVFWIVVGFMLLVVVIRLIRGGGGGGGGKAGSGGGGCGGFWFGGSCGGDLGCGASGCGGCGGCGG